MTSDKIIMVIDGIVYKSWDSVNVKRSMTNLCGSFSFSSTQSKPFDVKKWPIITGKLCEIMVGDTLVITGYVEDIDVNYSADSHSVSVSGRGVTCDLVDCHKISGSYDMSGQSCQSVVDSQCTPFGIQVYVDSTATEAANVSKPTFYPGPGESIAGIIYGICAYAKVFAYETPRGDLLLTLVGNTFASTPLVSGRNILQAGAKQSDKELFSRYVVKGYGTETDGLSKSEQWVFMYGSYPVNPKESLLKDKARYRPYAHSAETAVAVNDMKRRCEEEAQYKIGSSISFAITVQGWLSDGKKELWDINTRVRVTDPFLGLSDTELLIESVTYVFTDKGTFTNMELCYPDKYTRKLNVDNIKALFSYGQKINTK